MSWKRSFSTLTDPAGPLPSFVSPDDNVLTWINFFRDENDAYDKLALSVDGDLLTDIYLQNRKSFAVQKAGGAQASVKDVDIQRAQAERQAGDTPTYVIRGQWTATGTVGHWEHVHTRKNQYDAIVTVRADQCDRKISGLELLEEQRIDPAAPGANAAR